MAPKDSSGSLEAKLLLVAWGMCKLNLNKIVERKTNSDTTPEN